MPNANEIFKAAIQLEPIERAKLVDQIIQNLDTPDKELDKLWAEEAESRLAAYQSGKISSITLDEVLEKYK